MVNKGQLSLSHSLKKRYTKVRVKITKKNARPTNRNKFLISHDFILLLDLLSFFFHLRLFEFTIVIQQKSMAQPSRARVYADCNTHRPR